MLMNLEVRFDDIQVQVPDLRCLIILEGGLLVWMTNKQTLAKMLAN